MEEHRISFALSPEMLDSITGIFRIFLGKEFMAILISSCTIGIFTYGILELFMKTGLLIEFPKKRMSEAESGRFTISLLLIAATFLPWSVALTTGASTMMTKMGNLLMALIISVVGCFIFSWILKSRVPEHKRKHFLIPEAFKSIVDVCAAHMADWIASLFVGIINMGIKIIHKPFIMEYKTMAIILNLVVSMLLISIIGVSNDAGRANLAGSVLGGLFHWMFRRKEVARLRAIYQQGDKP